MTQPKFAIGEEVILVSKTYPQCNGEYTVEDIQKIPPHDFFVCKWAGVLFESTKESYIYKLEGHIYYLEEGIEGYAVRESSLRKKHKPADDEFQEWFKSVVDGKKSSSTTKGKVVAKD